MAKVLIIFLAGTYWVPSSSCSTKKSFWASKSATFPLTLYSKFPSLSYAFPYLSGPYPLTNLHLSRAILNNSLSNILWKSGLLQFSLNVLKAFLSHSLFNKGISILVNDLLTVLIWTSIFLGFSFTLSIAFIPISFVFSIIVLLPSSQVWTFLITSFFFFDIILNLFSFDTFDSLLFGFVAGISNSSNSI